MKKFVTLLLASLALINLTFAAQTFTSMADGNLNSSAVWSTDGGLTNCNCSPVSEFGGLLAANLGSIEINHAITANIRTAVLGSGIIVNINPSGSLEVKDEFEVRAGVVNNHGNLIADKATVYNSGFLHSMGILEIKNGDLVNAFQGRIEIFGQVFVRQGSISNLGWITLRTGSQVVAAGDLTNDAFIDMEPGSCMNLYGEVQNNFEMDLINGPGASYVQSGGNITNDSLWNTSINYCAAGTVTGLAFAPNCTGCGTLPVELVEFNATIDQDQTLLTWATESETQNAFFTIERSADGESFENIMEIASQNPVNGTSYQAVDPAPFYGVSWYRLSQTDLDGTTRTLETVMINNNGEVNNAHFNAFPNPFTETIRVTTFGMEGGAVNITVMDMSGKVIASKKVDHTNDYEVYEIQPGNINPGLYIVTVNGKQQSESFKLLHR